MMFQAALDVDWLVDHGFAPDVLEMLVGENEYADHDAFESLDKYSHRLRGMAIRHLEFLIDHGKGTEPVEVDGKILSPYPDYFAAWKLAGCPGLSLHQLNRLVVAKRS